MKRRVPHKNEVDNLVSVDGKTVFSIRKRKDGNYEFYVEILQFDNEEDVYYWSQDMLPRPSIFGSIIQLWVLKVVVLISILKALFCLFYFKSNFSNVCFCPKADIGYFIEETF